MKKITDNRLSTVFNSIIDYVLGSFSVIIDYMLYKTKTMLTWDQTTTTKLTPLPLWCITNFSNPSEPLRNSLFTVVVLCMASRLTWKIAKSNGNNVNDTILHDFLLNLPHFLFPLQSNKNTLSTFPSLTLSTSPFNRSKLGWHQQSVYGYSATSRSKQALRLCLD